MKCVQKAKVSLKLADIVLMAKLLFVLLILPCCVSHAETRQETYYNSCYASYYTAVINYSSISPIQARQNAKDLCTTAKERWDKEKAWEGMKWPMLMGCYHAMEMAQAKHLVPKICKGIGER